jgi:hypothetical protein
MGDTDEAIKDTPFINRLIDRSAIGAFLRDLVGNTSNAPGI